MSDRVTRSEGEASGVSPICAVDLLGLAVRVGCMQLLAALCIGCCVAYVVRSQPVAADARSNDVSLRLTTFAGDSSVLPTSIKDGFSLRIRQGTSGFNK